MAVAIPLVFAVAGSSVGGAIGIGAAAGWAIGSAIGSVVEQHFFGSELPPNALTDLSVQTSSWGTGLPKIYGSQRISGNIIWSTDKRLIGGSQGKYGGKGGGGGKSGGKKGGGSQGYYEVSIAIALCEGPISGIKRIWAGGNLIFDDSNPVYVPNMSGGAGGNQTFVAQNGTDTSSGGSALGNWIVYHGTGTQMPDPTIAANGSALGPNGVPYSTVTSQGQSYSYGSPEFGKLGTATAYRGVAYIVFPNLNIGYGGTIPPLSFEVVGAGATTNGFMQYKTGALPFNPSVADASSTSVAFSDSFGAAYLNTASFEIINISQSLGNVRIPVSNAVLVPDGVVYTGGLFYWVGTLLVGASYEGAGMKKICDTSDNFADFTTVCYKSFSGIPIYINNNGNTTDKPPKTWNPLAYTNSKTRYSIPYLLSGQYNDNHFPHFIDTNGNGSAYYLSNTDIINTTSDGMGIGFSLFASGVVTLASKDSISIIFFDENWIYLVVYRGSLATPVIEIWGVVPKETADVLGLTAGSSHHLATITDSSAVGFSDPSVLTQNNWVANNGAFYLSIAAYYPADNSANEIIAFDSSGNVLSRVSLAQLNRFYTFVFALPTGLLCLGNGYWDFWTYPGVTLNPGTLTSNLLPAVLQSECLSAGLSTVDVSKVPSLSVNMTRKAGTAARDVLRTLCQIYMMDMVDSAGTLRFVPKGQPIAEVLDMKDIGHGKLTTGAPAAPYSFTRAQGSDLPRSLTLKYTSALAFFNPYAQRFDVASAAKTGKDVTVNVPMLTLDDKTALNIAMVLCASPHIEKTAYVWTMPLSFCYLEPGDVVQAPWGVARITQVSLRDSQGEPVVELQGVIDATYVLNSGNGQAKAVATPQLGAPTNTSSTPLPPTSAPIIGGNTGLSGAGTVNSGTPGKAAPIIGAAMANYIEVPPLTSSDTSPFFIAAAYTTGNTFPGAAFYESTDGGSTFADMAQQANSSFVGWALNALPNTQAWTWDTQSTLSVYPLSSGVTLAAATDAQIFAGANLAAIGNELIQFSNATLTTDASGQPFYLLSRLLRGRKGTQWAMASHGGSETFVLISGNVTDIPYGLHDINQNAQWKVATVTSDITAIGAQTFSPTGIWYKPWAVADAVAKVDSSNNWNLAFFPVARLNGVWGSGFAPGLDADTQTWSIDVLSNGAVVRTVNGPLTTPSFQYTAAMQSADGFYPGQHGITLNIYQVGQLGRGYPSTITT